MQECYLTWCLDWSWIKQNLAKEHVEKMIDDVLPEEAKQNSMISSRTIQNIHLRMQRMPSWQQRKKLPIPMKDGKLLPIEQHFTIRFDPNTRKVELIQDDVQTS